LIDSADLGVSVAIAQLEGAGGISFDYLLAHTAARDWAIAYTDTLLEQMASTSGKLVGSTVARWFENREPLEQLIQDLEPVFGRKRAERIAATEVTRAAAEGSRLSYIESGVVEKVQWRTARDERTCPVCAPLEGKHAGLDGNFNGVSVPAHPNCRCWLVPVV
jgi:SPP1 gp7 family putative phage head morphogenesis protein